MGQETLRKEFRMLPLVEGACLECAMLHEAGDPHNKASLFYQIKFFMDNGRWPTWEDAMSHCVESVKNIWIAQLKSRGVKIS